MADCRDAAAESPDSGPAARALRATAASASVASRRAYREFLDHAAGCDTCRTSGEDCDTAAQLRQIWRLARQAAAT